MGKSGEVVEAFVEVSFDGGQTWPFLRGVGSHGGDYFFRNGSLAVETTLSFELPEPNNNQRRARVILDRFMTVDTAANLDFEVDGRV